MRRLLGLGIASLLLASLAMPSTPVTAAPNTGMTKAQIMAMEKSLGKAFVDAAARVKIKPPSCNKTGTSCLMWWNFDTYSKCSAGGSIHTIGSLTGTVAPAQLGGKVWLHGSIMQPILDWKCIGGWVVNTDPSLTNTVQLSVNGPTLKYSMTRGGAWTATSQKGVTPKRVQTCHVSGTTWVNVGGLANIGNRSQLRLTCVPGGTYSFDMSF